jgi:hypothetical protein
MTGPLTPRLLERENDGDEIGLKGNATGIGLLPSHIFILLDGS